MISAINGYDVACKVAASKKLAQEVEEFRLKKMGEIGTKIIEETKKEKKEKRKSPQGKIDRLAYQKPMLERAKKAFGFQTWKKLSDAVGNIISSSHLGCIYRGDYSISNMNTWSKIEKAIKDQEKKASESDES